MSDTDTTEPVDEQPAVVEIEQTHNPADVMVPGEHLPCGGVNFRRGMCRDGYLGRHVCDACAPVAALAVEAKPAKPARASKRSG